MISGATRGAGGPALGRHLTRATDNERVVDLEGRGLIATDIRGRVAELTRLGSHARTRTPLYHVHVDPPADRPWTADERSAWWAGFEAEFGLTDRPYAAVLHLKKGRAHEHRVYLRVRPDGSAIRLDHDYARRERLARQFEIARGEEPVPGAHNRAVIGWLGREGHTKEAGALRDAGLGAIERPRASLTPDERNQENRTGIDVQKLRAGTLAAWRASDDGASFRNALGERGLRLVQGAKTVQLIDPSGAAHDLRRTLSAASKTSGAGSIRASDIRERLRGVDLQAVVQVAPAIVDPALGETLQERGVTSHDEPSETNSEGRPFAEGPTLEPRADPGGAGRDSGAGDPAGDRPQGDELGAVRAVANGGNRGGSEVLAEPVGAAGRSGTEWLRPDADAPGDSCRGSDPDRGEIGRAGARDRIACRRLAERAGTSTERIDGLIEALRDSQRVLARATKQLDAADARIRTILASEPFRDDRDRDPDIIAADRFETLDREHERLVTEAARAALEAGAARAALTVWDRWLPWTTSRRRLSLDANALSGVTATSLATFQGELEEKRRVIRRRAVDVARRRERERGTWLDRPDVQAATAARCRNRDQREALRRGDVQVAICLLREKEDANRPPTSVARSQSLPEPA